jgi:Protein of unknown function (DUF2911)
MNSVNPKPKLIEATLYKLILSALVIAAATLTGWPALAQQKARISPTEVGSWTVDGSRIMIIYSRPYSKDPKDPKGEKIRKIWGELVPFGKPWRTGANEATILISEKPIEIGKTTIPGGVAYTLYTLPMESGPSKLIINKQLAQGGDQYDEKQDLARIDMKKEPLDKRLDQFAITIDTNPAGAAVLKLMWENTQFSVPIAVKK